MPSAGRCGFWNVASRAGNLVLQALSHKTKAFSISLQYAGADALLLTFVTWL